VVEQPQDQDQLWPLGGKGCHGQHQQQQQQQYPNSSNEGIVVNIIPDPFLPLGNHILVVDGNRLLLLLPRRLPGLPVAVGPRVRVRICRHYRHYHRKEGPQPKLPQQQQQQQQQQRPQQKKNCHRHKRSNGTWNRNVGLNF